MNYYCSYPPSSDRNPFFKILANHLNHLGYYEKTINFRLYTLFINRNKIKILWFHWPNALWRSKNYFLKLLKVLRFIIHVYFAKLFGYKLVWSVHNVLPHGEQSSKLELILRKFIIQEFNFVIGHANNTLSMLKDKGLFPKNYGLAIHGHYENEYESRNLEINRESLCISRDETVILIRSGYKNYESAKEFSKLFTNINLKKIKLLVLGKEIAQADNVIYIPGFLSNEDLSSYMEISDLICLPYDNITTSGAYFLALTFEKPIIAKNTRFFIEHTTERTALLYKDSTELKEKLILLDKNKIKFERKDILKLKKTYSWKDSALVIAKEFDDLI